jgi:hypothetical protein
MGSANYKVIYHDGETIDLRTKVCSGRLTIDESHLRISSAFNVSIPINSLLSTELFRLHNTGRMVKIVHSQGTLFVSVIRFNLFGYFALINYFGTGSLHRRLQDIISANGRA